MKKMLGLIFAVLLLMVAPVFAGSGGGDSDAEANANASANMPINAPLVYESGNSSAYGGTGVGYGGTGVAQSNSGAQIYAPDYSYNPQSQYNQIDNRVRNKVNVDTNIKNNVDIDNTDVNINKNVIERGAVQNHNLNIQGQSQGQRQGQNQGQLQGQGQEMNNEQTIAPTQTTTIITEKPFVAIPIVGAPELNFGNGRMVDASKMLPKFKGVALLKNGDTIHTVVDVIANVPFKKLYKTILKLAKENAVQAPYMRFQIIRAEGQKSWTTGSAVSGGGTGVVGTSGVAGGGSLIPSIGGTKAHDLFTIVVVNVIPE